MGEWVIKWQTWLSVETSKLGHTRARGPNFNYTLMLLVSSQKETQGRGELLNESINPVCSSVEEDTFRVMG